MVSLVEEWEFLEEYGERLGFFQILEGDASGKVEIRVLSGECGFTKEFDNVNDSELKRILDYCTRHKYAKLTGKMDAEELFK